MMNEFPLCVHSLAAYTLYTLHIAWAEVLPLKSILALAEYGKLVKGECWHNNL